MFDAMLWLLVIYVLAALATLVLLSMRADGYRMEGDGWTEKDRRFGRIGWLLSQVLMSILWPLFWAIRIGVIVFGLYVPKPKLAQWVSSITGRKMHYVNPETPDDPLPRDSEEIVQPVLVSIRRGEECYELSVLVDGVEHQLKTEWLSVYVEWPGLFELVWDKQRGIYNGCDVPAELQADVIACLAKQELQSHGSA